MKYPLGVFSALSKNLSTEKHISGIIELCNGKQLFFLQNRSRMFFVILYLQWISAAIRVLGPEVQNFRESVSFGDRKRHVRPHRANLPVDNVFFGVLEVLFTFPALFCFKSYSLRNIRFRCKKWVWVHKLFCFLGGHFRVTSAPLRKPTRTL